MLDGEPLTAEAVRAALRDACREHGAPAPPDVLVASVWQGTGTIPARGPLPARPADPGRSLAARRGVRVLGGHDPDVRRRRAAGRSREQRGARASGARGGPHSRPTGRLRARAARHRLRRVRGGRAPDATDRPRRGRAGRGLPVLARARRRAARARGPAPRPWGRERARRRRRDRASSRALERGDRRACGSRISCSSPRTAARRSRTTRTTSRPDPQAPNARRAAVPQTAVADGERRGAELREHRADDAGAGEDDLGALGLEADDRTPLVGARACGRARSAGRSRRRSSTVPWTTVRVVGREPVLHRREVRHGAAHPDERVGRRPAVEAREVGGDRRRAPRRARSSATAPSRPKRSVKRTAPTSTLNRSSTWSPWPNVNCELPPPVSKTTSEPVDAPSPADRGEVGEPALLLAGDHLDLDAGSAPARRATNVGAVGRDAQPGGADRGDRLARPCRRASSTIPAIASAVRSIASAPSRPSSSSPSPSRVTSARSTTVRHDAVRRSLADVELHRVRPDVDRRRTGARRSRRAR